MSATVPEGEIVSVSYHFTGDADHRTNAVVAVITHDQFRGDSPVEGGIDDLYMGTTDSRYRCSTCRQDKQNCLGHEGFIHLKYPVIHPLMKDELTKWLNIICHSCGSILVQPSVYAHLPAAERFFAATHAKFTGSCRACRAVQQKIAMKENIYYYATAEPTITQLFPHQIKKIIERITDESITSLGKSLRSHVRNSILTNIPVPPVVTRPAVRRVTGARVTNSEATTMLQLIIKRNDSIPQTIPTNMTTEFIKMINDLNERVYGAFRGGGEEASMSYAVSLKGKHGLFRGNILGKRCNGMARSTIIGDLMTPIDALGIPFHFAKTIDVEETVRKHNFDRLLGYVRNGREKYPGATAVIKAGTRVRIDIGYVNATDVRPGDIVCRNIIDGDYALFNRQPTLMISNMSAHRIIVMRDPESYPIRMNVCATPWYNADFDGDAMNLVFVSNESARVELRMLSAAKNWFTSLSSSSPPIGQVEDGVVGMARLTQDNTRLNRYHASRIFDNTSLSPKFTKDVYDGRELISLLLKDTPVNFRRVPTSYRQQMAPYMNYTDTERIVDIRNGVMLTGILDKTSIGKDARGGLHHIIANEYGPDIALRFMHDMQKAAVTYLNSVGYGIGLGDFVLPQSAYDEIDRVHSQLMKRAETLSKDLIDGNIVPSFGQTIETMYEGQIKEILKVPDAFYKIVLENINPRVNGLFQMVLCGSKGSPENIFNMVVSCGQKLLNGQRTPLKFGVGRASAYARRFSTDPIDRGYIGNSLMVGMNSIEYLTSAGASRLDLITKALNTSITGEMNRQSTICLSPIISDNYMRTVKNGIVLQLAYGDNFADARYAEDVTFPTVMLSDADMRSKYYNNKYSAFFDAMMRDRDQYRKYFLAIERVNKQSDFTGEVRMLFNLERIISNVMEIRASGDNARKYTEKDLSASMDVLQNAIDVIPYVFMNSIMERKRVEILPHFVAAAWLPQMIIRSLLNPATLMQRRITVEELKGIFARIRVKMLNSIMTPGTSIGIIAAQSYSEPLTQYMLDAHHRSATGGSSFSAVQDVKAVFEAKETKKIKRTQMFICVKPEYETDARKVSEIANNIEISHLREFVTRYQIFMESFGEPVHPRFIDEARMIKQFVEMNPLLPPPNDLINACIRIELSKSNIIMKDMPLDAIIARLREIYPHYYFVYTPETAREIILRVYIRSNVAPMGVNIRDKAAALMDTTVRGIAGINGAKVIEVERHYVADDGSIAARKIHAIETSGTNLVEVLSARGVDPQRVVSNSVKEMAEVFGIVAARQQIMHLLYNVISTGCNWCHLGIYADEMTSTGEITAITLTGVSVREYNNILLRMGMASPLRHLIEGASRNARNAVGDMMSRVMVGGIPKIGTNYNSYIIDTEFVRKHIKTPSDIIDNVYA